MEIVSRYMTAIYNRVNRVLLLLTPTKNRWPLHRLEEGVKAGYLHNHRRTLDLDNPVLFTEKIQWYKLYYKNPVLNECVDKYQFKEYINKKLGKRYTIPLFGAWGCIDDLIRDWDKLPSRFVLKSNAQGDGKYIKFIRDKNTVNKRQLMKELKPWLKTRNLLINSYCRAYYGVVPRIIAEQYIDGMSNTIDYKVFCFSGEPYCIYASSYDTSSNEHFSAITFYDTSWAKVNVTLSGANNPDVDKPVHLEEMLLISQKLSSAFPFVRVDFFESNSFLYVAELTFYPSGGYLKFDPLSFDRAMGDAFTLPDRM